MMFSYLWPIALVIVSNTVYQICAKSVPEGIHPMASLVVTYLIAAGACALMYFLMKPGGNLLQELKGLNWAPIALGVVIVGLEVGWIYAYQAGWEVSMGFIVQSAVLACLLLAVGYFLYHEAITWNKALGIAVCLGGLVLMNLK